MVPAEAGASSDLLACRVCLHAAGRLMPISSSGFEDTFAELTGVQLLMEGFPRHLCAFCRANLSKCAAFRDRCHRSTALLHTLLEMGPLTIKDIEGIDRKSHRLSNGMAKEKVFHYQTHPYLQIPPIKSENTPDREITICPDKVYLEEIDQENCIEDLNMDSRDNGLQIKINKVKSEKEHSNELSKINECLNDFETHTSYVEMEIDETGVNMENDEETTLVKEARSIPVELERKNSTKTTKSRAVNTRPSFKSKKRKKIGDDFYPLFDYKAFEEEFNVKIKFLTVEEQRQEIEDKKKANKSVFCCEMCGKGCNTEKTMKNHLSCHDQNAGSLECEICRVRFRETAGPRLQRHRDAHRLVFACRDCGFLSRDKSNAKLHSLVHSGKTYTCQHCGQTYKHRTSYLTHVRERHPAENVACDTCGETFLSENGVRQHKAKAHGDDAKAKSDVKCSVCDVTFVSKEALDKHTADEGVPHALWPCAACGESCGSEPALAAHAAEKHPPERHHCDESEAALKFHLYTHMEQKPYACPLCPKTFAAKSGREFHLRAHKGERPYQCADCPLACTLKGTLVRHIARVHLKQTRQFPCDICHKTFTERAGVKLHVRTVHNNNAPRRVRRPKKLGTSSLE